MDKADHGQRRRALHKLLFSSSSRPRVRFAVVSEPTSGSADCIDLGAAEADLSGMARGAGDITEAALEVFPEHGRGDGKPIGTLTVSILGKEVVKAMKKK